MRSDKESVMRPHFSFLALVSFIVSFAIARTFSFILPDTVLIISGSHIHHFWFGLAMIAIGGWLGIVYDSDRIDRVAAVLYGVGGGLVGDEIGLLVTFQNYWSEITYTFIIGVVAAASIIILTLRYSRILRMEFSEFIHGNRSLYFGVFLECLSIAFILETDDFLVTIFSGLGGVAAALIIAAYFAQRYLGDHSNRKEPSTL